MGKGILGLTIIYVRKIDYFTVKKEFRGEVELNNFR